jgi:N-acetylmuramic acid 6-phosphate etherase
MPPVNYAALSTEQVHPGSQSLDHLTPSQIIRLMNREDRKVLDAIRSASPQISWAVRLISGALSKGGRLFFIGAGTSGRLGVIEAAECPPTFNTKPDQVQAIMAGGKSAVFKSKEGAEDSGKAAVSACRRAGVRRKDVVVGVAASGVTPFVRAALEFARQRKARTILVTCNPHPPKVAQVTIALPTGPEILAGSTRLKAGTACKMVLNMLTTASLVQMGKVYGNRMVDLQPKSRKLVERGIRLIRELGCVREAEARRIFKESQGHVKAAIVMARKKWSYPEAEKALSRADGFLRKIL